MNINYLYIQAPTKIEKNQKISKIYNDYSNYNMDKLLNLIKNKVDYIDLRNNIANSTFEYKSLFFYTDHHWLPTTGLWVAKEISNYLNTKYNMNLDIQNINEDNFNYTKYSKMFLGSEGRKVSLANAKPDDFTIITPKFTTKLNVKIPDRHINKIGTYEETLINWKNVKYENYYKISQYNSYMYPGSKLIEIKNENIHNNKKILWIQDSYSDVVTPFISLETEYLSLIDLREFDGSLKSYISENRPDIVITMYTGGVLAEPEESKIRDRLWLYLNK